MMKHFNTWICSPIFPVNRLAAVRLFPQLRVLDVGDMIDGEDVHSILTLRFWGRDDVNPMSYERSVEPNQIQPTRLLFLKQPLVFLSGLAVGITHLWINDVNGSLCAQGSDGIAKDLKRWKPRKPGRRRSLTGSEDCMAWCMVMYIFAMCCILNNEELVGLQRCLLHCSKDAKNG